MAPSLHSQVKLIWHKSDGLYFEPAIHAWRYFRKSFLLSTRELGVNTQYQLDIYVSDRYMLYINGQYVCRGPSRTDRRWAQFDRQSINKYLHPGHNTIAVLCLSYGYGTGQSTNGIRALALQLISHTEGKENIHVVSDDSWKTAIATPYQAHAPRINGRQGPIEVYDAREVFTDWQAVGFDDSSWTSAALYPRDLIDSPYWNLSLRDIPLLDEEINNTCKITATGHGVASNALAAPTSSIVHFIADSLSHASLRLDDTIRRHSDQKIRYVPGTGKNTTTPTLLLYSFEQLCPGYLIIDTEGGEGSVIDCIYAEDITHNPEPSQYGKPILHSDNRPVDRFILAEGANKFEVAFAWKAIKHVLLMVYPSSRDMQINRVAMRTRMYPFHQSGNFNSSNSRYDQIYKLCEHTLKICAQDGFIDSPGREQQQWMGDGRWTALAYFHLTGDSQLYKRLLLQIGQSQDWTGMVKPRHPDDHNNIPPIPAYCLSWISSFYEYYQHTGDIKPVKEAWFNIQHALCWFEQWENEAGLLQDVPQWMFIDWGYAPRTMDVKRGGMIAALNLQYIEALQFLTTLAQTLGDTVSSDKYRVKRDAITIAARDVFWNEKKQAYTDCVVDEVQSTVISEQTNALALLYLHGQGNYKSDEVWSPQRVTNIIENVFSNSWLPELNNLNSTETPVPASPFYMVRVLLALTVHDQHDLAFRLLNSRYSLFLDAGNDTTWEKWTLYRNTPDGELTIDSASHAWGASIILFYMINNLGIKPLSPGYHSIEFSPGLRSLSRVSGTVPTPQGPITVKITNNTAHISYPEESQLFYNSEVVRNNPAIITLE